MNLCQLLVCFNEIGVGIENDIISHNTQVTTHKWNGIEKLAHLW